MVYDDMICLSGDSAAFQCHLSYCRISSDVYEMYVHLKCYSVVKKQINSAPVHEPRLLGSYFNKRGGPNDDFLHRDRNNGDMLIDISEDRRSRTSRNPVMKDFETWAAGSSASLKYFNTCGICFQ